MKKIIIDTNALISFVTDRNLAQQEKIARLFNDAASLKKNILCHHHVLSEFVYVLSSVYHCRDKDIHDMIAALISMPGIELATDVHMATILTYWPTKIPDYGDAVIAMLCKKTKGATIATFDEKFRNAAGNLGLPLCTL